MLFQNDHAHSAHRIFGDAIGVEYRHFETGERPYNRLNQNVGSIPRRAITGATLSGGYDVVIAEGTAPLHTLLAYKLSHPEATALYLAADETFYTLTNRSSRYIWEVLRPLAKRLLDGVITVSEDAYEWAQPYIGDQPYRIVHPPISNDKYSRLESLPPTSPVSPFYILTVGEARESKQLSNLVRAVNKIYEDLGKNIELVILGEGHSNQWYAAHDYVHTPGFVPIKVFIEWFERASIYVQPSNGDSYPVASLEAMLAATPTVVTESCGTRDRVPNDQIATPDVDGLVNRIQYMIELSEKERKKRGETHRKDVRGLTEASQQEVFKDAVEELVTDD